MVNSNRGQNNQTIINRYRSFANYLRLARNEVQAEIKPNDSFVFELELDRLKEKTENLISTLYHAKDIAKALNELEAMLLAFQLKYKYQGFNQILAQIQLDKTPSKPIETIDDAIESNTEAKPIVSQVVKPQVQSKQPSRSLLGEGELVEDVEFVDEEKNKKKAWSSLPPLNSNTRTIEDIIEDGTEPKTFEQSIEQSDDEQAIEIVSAEITKEGKTEVDISGDDKGTNLVKALNTYIKNRLKKAGIEVNFPELYTLDVINLKETREKIQSHYYHGFFNELFGFGHDAYTKLSAAIKLREVIKLKIKGELSAQAIKENGLQLTEIEKEALKAGDLGKLVKQNKNLIPDIFWETVDAPRKRNGKR